MTRFDFVCPTGVHPYLQRMSRPVHIVRIVNLKPGAAWRFDLTFDTDSGPTLSIGLPEVYEGSLLESLVPEVFFGEPKWVSDRTLEIVGFGGERLEPSLATSSQIEKTFAHQTWLGSQTYVNSPQKVIWRAMGHEWPFRSREVAGTLPSGITETLRFNGLAVMVHVPFIGATWRVRDCGLGDLPTEESSPMRAFLRSVGIEKAFVEFGPGWWEMGPMGLPQTTAGGLGAMRNLAASCDSLPSAERMVQALKRNKLEREAARLSERKAQARSAPRVYWRDRILGAEPTSEAGTVAIIHKLEALGGIPVYSFETRAWAGADGVDAIADFRIDGVHPQQHEIAVEYEFHFGSFLTHQHPHEHVELVICWDESGARGTLRPTEEPWLWYLENSGKQIPVLTVSTFPDIRIVKENSHE